MPNVNNAGKVYKDPRVQLIVGDAFAYRQETELKFDAVTIESTDPKGPGEKLFSHEFYKNIVKNLNENALISTQGGVPQFQSGEARATPCCLKDTGLNASCYIAAVPTYYGGYMTFRFGALNTAWSLPDLERIDRRSKKALIRTKHYSLAMRRASFVLPPWIEEDINTKSNKKEEAA